MNTLLRRTITNLGYSISGYPVAPHLNALKQSQFWPIEKLRAYQLQKYNALVRVANEKIPYYRELFKQYSIDTRQDQTWSDFVKFPILTKADIRSNFPHRLLNKDMKSSDVLMHKTGGSTGEPLLFGYDKTTMGLMAALVYRSFQWLGFAYGEKILYFVGMGDHHKSVRERVKETLADKRIINAYYLTDPHLLEYYHIIESRQIRVLYGYPSAISVLCAFCKANGLKFSRPLIVVTTGEKLSEHHRAQIEDFFGYRIFDQYGCREINSVSFEAPDGPGMYINMEHVIVEVLDDDGKPLPAGEPGNVVITDLDNFAMPMIRYRFGDRGCLLPRQVGASGIQLDRMGFVEGRDTDILYRTDGTPVTGIYFVKLMRGGLDEMIHYQAQGIRMFQVIQKSTDQIVLHIVTDKGGAPEAEAELRLAFRQKLGDVNVTINWVTEIKPNASGKRRMIVSEMQHPS